MEKVFQTGHANLRFHLKRTLMELTSVLEICNVLGQFVQNATRVGTLLNLRLHEDHPVRAVQLCKVDLVGTKNLLGDPILLIVFSQPQKEN